MSAVRVAALDIGGTNIKACLFENGVLVRQDECKTPAREGGMHVLERAASLITTYAPFDAVGVSTAGQVTPHTGVIRYANQNLPKYTGINVKDFFEHRFSVPTIVENDVNAAALGEGKCGAAVNISDYLCLTYGTGVGGAIVLGGDLWRGVHGSAGEFGGIVLHPEDILADDPFSGCYEHYASASALLRAARAQDSTLVGGRDLFHRLAEAPMRAVVDHWLDELATGLCTLIHILEPSCVVLGGGVMEQQYAIDGARKRVLTRLIPSFRSTAIVGAKLGNLAGLYGALSIVEREVLHE